MLSGGNGAGMGAARESWDGEAEPRVTVVVPVFNEERYVEDCVRSIMAQSYPRELLDIVVVDGMSTDRTARIVRNLAREDTRIRLLCSPRRRIPFSMNIGLAAATGDVIVRVDGHSVVETEHVSRCVDYLCRTKSDHVGGVMKATGHTYVARAIALAMSSPFGVGTARFRYTTREQAVDTVPFGAYRLDMLRRLGGFDERFQIGEDAELDFRINLAGGQVRVTPAISTEYYCRESLRRLAVQYVRYGRAKAFILHKHRSLPSPRALAPAGLVLLVASLAVASPISGLARLALVACVSLYLVGSIAASAIVASRHGWRYAPLLPVAFAVLHVSHGAGFLSGLPTLLTRRRFDRMHGSLTTQPCRPALREASDWEAAS